MLTRYPTSQSHKTFALPAQIPAICVLPQPNSKAIARDKTPSKVQLSDMRQSFLPVELAN